MSAKIAAGLSYDCSAEKAATFPDSQVEAVHGAPAVDS